MGEANELIAINARVSKDQYDSLVELARQRGVSANTVLQQAIAREKLLSDKEQSGGIVLVQEKDKTFKRIVR